MHKQIDTIVVLLTLFTLSFIINIFNITMRIQKGNTQDVWMFVATDIMILLSMIVVIYTHRKRKKEDSLDLTKD